MRKLILISALAFVFAGCSKDDDDPTPPASNTELLTNNTWQVDELIQQVGNSQTSYVRGGANTTGSNYGVARLKFNEDGTGSFTDPLNATYDLEWDWVGAGERKMSVTIDYPVPTVLTYSMVTVNQNNFTYTTYFQDGPNNAISTATWIPAP